MTGELLFDGGNNIMVMNDQSLRLKSSRDDNPNSSSTHVTVGRNADGDAVTGIYHWSNVLNSQNGLSTWSTAMRKINCYKTKLMTL